MKTLKLLLLLVIAALSFSAQFVIVKDVYEDAGSITAQKYGYKDFNGDYVAILKVKTDIEGLSFKSMTLDKSEYMGTGIYHVYMQPGSRMLEFMKTGYISIKHQFPRQLESNKVYVIEVKGVGEEKKIEDITINILGEPQGATITFDGAHQGTVKSLKTSVGKHELKITKDGFQTYKANIEVSADKTLFNYKLEKVEDAIIVIDSNPQGAMVYIDGVKIDKTPISSFYPAGTYKIRLSSDKYEDIEEEIVIKGPETKKTFQLTDIRATLTINTHEKAKVYLNGEQITNYKNIKLAPQQCIVKVEMNKAKPLEERFILKKKENKTIDMLPQISIGTIQIAVIPTDAEIELSEDGGEKYTSTGAKSFSNVPVGTYKLKVSKKGFKTHTEDIRLTADAIEKKSVKLEEGIQETNGAKAITDNKSNSFNINYNSRGMTDGYRINITNTDSEKKALRIEKQVREAVQAPVYIELIVDKYMIYAGDCQNKEEANILKEKLINAGFKQVYSVPKKVYRK
ncbi:MAG: PEGA domain-containing protein [Candidatus Delongbacteria bacterium]|nr:PEGA domain-containing protein [Candidatus Delongbacteria bacterium]